MDSEIFSEVFEERRDLVPAGLPLIVTLLGFSDAGHAVAQLDQLLWDEYEPQLLMRFNNDLLLDYRARRPVITFEEDHLTDYLPEELLLSLARDENGSPFLLLSGYEPDFRWEEFTETVMELIEEFQVSSTTWVHAIPMPVPHTRPIGATVSGTNRELIEERSAWRPTTKLAATVGHLLEHKIQKAGGQVTGVVLLVPHYLANTEYPQALLSALDTIMSSTDLTFAVTEIMKSASEFNARVDEQVWDSEESSEMLRNLEHRYDEYMRHKLEGASAQLNEEEGLPSADQLASELERFLAEQRGNNDPDENGFSPS